MALNYDLKKDFRFKQGREEGLKEGIEEGIEKGKSIGETNAKKEVALKLLKKGILSKKEIAAIFGVSIKFINDLAKIESL